MTVFMHIGKIRLTYSFDPDTNHPTCGNCGKYLNVTETVVHTDDGGNETYLAWCPNHGAVNVVWEADEDDNDLCTWCDGPLEEGVCEDCDEAGTSPG